jgi:hypothetical protein
LKEEKLHLAYITPLLRSERLVNIYENKGKNSGEQNKSNNVAPFRQLFWYFFFQSSIRIKMLLKQN